MSSQADRVLGILDTCGPDLTRLVSELVRVPSVTGSEGLVVPLLRQWLSDLGLTWEEQRISAYSQATTSFLASEPDLDERPNVIVRLGPQGQGPGELVLNAHLDVVPPGREDLWSFEPFSGTVSEGRVWGRGSADIKGGVGAAVFAMAALQQSGFHPRCRVQLQLVVGEETGGMGSLHALASQPHPAAAIVLEPTECRVVCACSGSIHFTITAKGRAAHGSTPWFGVSAFDRLQELDRKLRAYAQLKNECPQDPMWQEIPEMAPLTIGVVRAGEWRATIPDEAYMSGRMGVLPGESVRSVQGEISQQISEVNRADPWFSQHPAMVQWENGGYPSWRTPPTAPLVECIRSALKSIELSSKPAAATFGSDAGHFAAADVPTILFGPGSIAEAHQKDEHVEVRQFANAAKVLALTIMRWNESVMADQ